MHSLDPFLLVTAILVSAACAIAFNFRRPGYFQALLRNRDRTNVREKDESPDSRIAPLQPNGKSEETALQSIRGMDTRLRQLETLCAHYVTHEELVAALNVATQRESLLYEVVSLMREKQRKIEHQLQQQVDRFDEEVDVRPEVAQNA